MRCALSQGAPTPTGGPQHGIRIRFRCGTLPPNEEGSRVRQRLHNGIMLLQESWSRTNPLKKFTLRQSQQHARWSPHSIQIFRIFGYYRRSFMRFAPRNGQVSRSHSISPGIMRALQMSKIRFASSHFPCPHQLFPPATQLFGSTAPYKMLSQATVSEHVIR